MSRSKRDRHKGATDDQGIDLLGAAFNLPTRRNIELAERRAAHAHQVKIQYQGNELNIGESEFSSSSDDGSEEPKSVPVKSQRLSSPPPPPPRRQPEQRHNPPRRQRSKKLQKAIIDKPLPTRKSKQRLTKSSSTNSTRISSTLAPSIPTSATFPPSRTNHVHVYSAVKGPGCRAAAAAAALLSAPFAFTTIPAASQMPHYATPANLQNIAHASTDAIPHSEPPTLASRQQVSTGSLAQQIQNIQAEIDQRIAMVSENPTNDILKNELATLQAKLNSTLNAVLNLKEPTQVSQEPESLVANKLNATNKSVSASEKLARSKKVASSRSVQDHEAISSEILDLDPKSNILPTSQRGVSPERTIRHHLCSGCGSVRSSRFHEKHPIAPGEKPVLNYYESCQKANTEDSLLERYHFCFRCGVARSKEFQRQNPRRKGDLLAPNYCGKCTQEIQSIVDITEASVVGLNSELLNKRNGSLETSRVFVRAGKNAPGFTSLRDMPGYEAQHKSSYFDPPDYAAETHGEHGYFQARPKKKTIPKSLNLKHPSPQSSPASSTPATPYYPDRSIGSARRRARRSPLTNITGGYRSPFSSGASTHAYRSPYVEDVQSPIPPEPTSTHGISSRRNQHSKTDASKPTKDSHDSASNAHQPRQSWYKRGHSSRAKNDGDYIVVDQGSAESMEVHHSANSTEESAQSLEHKTVQFTQNVETYSEDSLVPSDVSTHRDIYKADTQPNVMPSVHDGHGTSPLMSNTKRPGSAPETANQDESYSHESHHDAIRSSGRDNSVSEFRSSEDHPEKPEQHEQERLWKGAFAKREKSGTGAWARRMSAAGEKQASPTQASHPLPSSPGSAGLSGFPPHVNEPFDRSNETFRDEDVDPPLRTSKGAFSSTAFKSSLFTHTTNINGPGSPQSTTSSPRNKEFTGTSGSPWETSFHTDSKRSEFPGVKPSESSFRPPSTFGGYSSRFDSECHTMRDDDSFTHGGYSEFSRSSSNPYYVPRKSSFADIKNRGGFGRRFSRTRDWWDDQRSKTKSKKTCDWFPEPIIEEPSSPISSPVQRAMLLEFHDDHTTTPSPVPPLCESSTESEEADDEPDISDIKEFLNEESDEDDKTDEKTIVARFYRN
ncbi:hypothetical protein PT974_08842 [Cladobotryum mycophilum]|uniref:Uncharacterized protein n=1 Tax=Cladobotryum mycophilum TaxID=491253 RepID=A0ABR0SEH6_9HYPO